MKKKKSGRLSRVDKYLYRNSYLYKWGKRLLKKRVVRFLVLGLIVLLLLNAGYEAFKVHQVKQFLRHWQQHQNNHRYHEFIRCIDMSADNPDRISFPDWKAQFFDSPVRLQLSELSVNRTESRLYRVEMTVSFQGKGEPMNRFRGIIYVREKNIFQITRVEI